MEFVKDTNRNPQGLDRLRATKPDNEPIIRRMESKLLLCSRMLVSPSSQNWETVTSKNCTHARKITYHRYGADTCRIRASSLNDANTTILFDEFVDVVWPSCCASDGEELGRRISSMDFTRKLYENNNGDPDVDIPDCCCIVRINNLDRVVLRAVPGGYKLHDTLCINRSRFVPADECGIWMSGPNYQDAISVFSCTYNFRNFFLTQKQRSS